MVKDGIKRNILSPYFCVSVIIMIFSMLCLSLPEWLAFDIDIREKPSALQMAVSGLFFGGYSLLLPFCSVFSGVTTFVDEIQNQFYCFELLRAGKRKYTYCKFIVSNIVGAISMMLAFSLHAALWHIIAIPSTPELYSSHMLTFADGCVYDELFPIFHGLPMLIWITCSIGIVSFIWSAIGLATAIWIPDKCLVLTIPSCIYYLWARGIFKVLFGINIPIPSALFNDGITISSSIVIIIICAVIWYTCLLLYKSGLKRRMLNE